MSLCIATSQFVASTCGPSKEKERYYCRHPKQPKRARKITRRNKSKQRVKVLQVLHEKLSITGFYTLRANTIRASKTDVSNTKRKYNSDLSGCTIGVFFKRWQCAMLLHCAWIMPVCIQVYCHSIYNQRLLKHLCVRLFAPAKQGLRQ